MIIGKDKDGCVIVLAKEHGIKPMFRSASGEWSLATHLTGEDLNDFRAVKDQDEINLLLAEAISAYEKIK